MPAQSTDKQGSMHIGWTIAIMIWSLSVVGILWWFTDYEFSSYEQDTDVAVTHWPNDTALELSSERPTLVFFVHPKCPCTRASLRELRRLLETSTVPVDELPVVTVVVNQPHGADAAWSDTDTVRDAALLPRVTMFADVGGVESELFGAVTSGAVMLFDTAGKRLFAGGITTSRGHEGDSTGSEMLQRLLKKEAPMAMVTLPTFGCRLCVPDENVESVPACTGKCSEPLP
jgi:hypothetical protein